MPVMKQLRIGSATYDTVGEASVTQVQTSGTKIATVTIDGTATDLYAPDGGGGSTVTVTPILTSGTQTATISVDGTTSTLYAPTPPTVPSASSTTPSMDGTAAVGTATTYARADHVHPTDTSRQATLVSGTNIKTINGTSILGSGDLPVGGSTVFYREYGNGNVSTGKLTIDGTDYEIWAYSQPSKATSTPLMDGTAAIGNSDRYAAENHVHPTDTSRQATLVSGTNIKTINGTSILGSGDITTPTYTLPTASTSTLGGVKVDGSTITITDGVISSSGGGGGGGSALTLYTDRNNYVLYLDAALTDDIASHYDNDYLALYQVMTDANSIKIINDTLKTAYYPQTVRYVSVDDEIRVTAGSVVWNV